MTSATRESTIRAAKKRAVEDARINATVISTLMSTVQGRRWIWRELEFAQIFIASETLDPARLAFNEGRRNSGLRLLSSVTQHAPAMYVRMTEENANVKLAPSDDDQQDDEDV